MRFAWRQMLAGLAALALLTTPLFGAGTSVLGVVLLADQAQLRAAGVTTGATVFDGDLLATELKGSLRVRAGLAQLQLLGGTAVMVNQTSTGVSATVKYGTLAASAPNAAALEMHADEALIRSQGNGEMRAQVTVVNSKELIVKAERGNLEITFDGQTEIVAESTAYRVFIDPPLMPSATTSSSPKRQDTRGGGGTRSAGRSRFILVALTVTSVVGIIAVHEALESPDRP